MEITRKVILDLLPLYLADEASDDTENLVKHYLANDPDLAHLARQWKERLPGPPPAPVRTEAQVEAYHAAQRQIAWKTVGLAGVIVVGLILIVALIGVLFLVPFP